MWLLRPVVRGNFIYETIKYVYHSQQFETIRSFAKDMFAGKTNLNDKNKIKSILIENIEFNKDTNPK